MSNFTLYRDGEGVNSTSGKLLSGDYILCSTIERAWLSNAPGVSRIPAGQYKLGLRKFGTSKFDDFYRKNFGPSHLGMIEVLGVPGRSAVELHMGNWYYQTEGCIMLGLRTERRNADFCIPGGESRAGYWPAYQEISKQILLGEVSFEVFDVTVDTVPLTV